MCPGQGRKQSSTVWRTLEKADKLIIGGGMMFTFLKALGKNVGKSKCEDDKVELASELLKKANGKIVLPVDTVVAKEFSNDAPFKTVSVDDIASVIFAIIPTANTK